MFDGIFPSLATQWHERHQSNAGQVSHSVHFPHVALIRVLRREVGLSTGRAAHGAISSPIRLAGYEVQ